MDEIEKNNINETSDKQGNNDLNSTSLENRPQNREETNGKQKKKKSKEKVNCHRRIQSASAIIMALCTLAIAEITAFYTHYASQQVCEMRKATHSAEISANAASIAANATQQTIINDRESANVDEEHFRLDHRAVISIYGIGTTGADGIGVGVLPKGAPLIIITFENSGQTPARKVFFHCRIESSLPKAIKFPSTKGNGGTFFMGPRSTNAHKEPITSEDLIKIQKGEKTIFVYGEADYFDIFDKRHRTQFCFQNSGVSITPDMKIASYDFAKCEKYDCADKDCDNQ